MIVDTKSIYQKNNYMNKYIQEFAKTISQNVSRCIALILWELSIVGIFHYLEWSFFSKSEMISFGLHFLLSIFWFCVFVIIRNKYIIGRWKRYHPLRILCEFAIYIFADFLLIHGFIAMINGEFHFEIMELLVMATVTYGINIYFDRFGHECCHRH